MASTTTIPHCEVAIIGGGIGGLTLAAALLKHAGIRATVFEQSREVSYSDGGTGGAIGLYANGLQILKDIDESLLDSICAQGMPYARRRWLRHDGTEFANANESLLLPPSTKDPRLSPLGIRRHRFQSQLLAHATTSHIPILFSKRLTSLTSTPSSPHTLLTFTDGSTYTATILFGADGVKSQVRAFLFPETTPPAYTGVTTLMCVSRTTSPTDPPVLPEGIHFISSVTSKFHACMYPLPDGETNVQIYLPIEKENPESWGKLTAEEMKVEAAAMVVKLRKDGWSERFITPWVAPETVIRVGLRARKPLEKWGEGRVVLLGDAAHPPVPYIGQGAMQAIEDAGVLALLVGKLCPLREGGVDWSRFGSVIALYEQIRVARCTQVLQNSHALGEMNQRRAESWWYNVWYEWGIWGEVWREGHLGVMKVGACYEYRLEVEKAVEGLVKGESRL
ncbi:hypothetical protein HDU98_002718 [Podochytrium sp. JEL0797]|nr:hypothetical protein HDU98_002718 [Podochytrium sp. JEL0797]